MNKQFKINFLSSKQSEAGIQSYSIENFDSNLSDSFCFSPDYVCPEKDCATPILQAEMTPKLKDYTSKKTHHSHESTAGPCSTPSHGMRVTAHYTRSLA